MCVVMEMFFLECWHLTCLQAQCRPCKGRSFWGAFDVVEGGVCFVRAADVIVVWEMREIGERVLWSIRRYV